MNIIQMLPNKWVTEDMLISLTQLKKGTIKRLRETKWAEGREYKKIQLGEAKSENAQCVYNREAIDAFFDKQKVI